MNFDQPKDIAALQPIVEALQNVKPDHTTKSTLGHISSILAQLMVVLDASCLTFYARDPWSGEYELRSTHGLKTPELVTDRLISGLGAFDQVLGGVEPAYLQGSCSRYVANSKNLYKVAGSPSTKSTEEPKVVPTRPAGYQSFAASEDVQSTLIIYAMEESRFEEAPSGLLFVNWREPGLNRERFFENPVVGPWLKLVSNALASAISILLRRSIPDVALLGRYHSLALRIGRGIVDSTADGPEKLAEWLSEDDSGTRCMIFEVDRGQLRLLTDPIHTGLGRDCSNCGIANKALEFNRVIYVPNFNDPSYRRYSRECDMMKAIDKENKMRVLSSTPTIPRMLSEVAIPISRPLIDKDNNIHQQVTYVFVLARPAPYAFSNDEISLLRASVRQFESVTRKADAVADAILHDQGNLLDAVNFYTALTILESEWDSAITDIAMGRIVPLDLVLMLQVISWSKSSSQIVAFGLCGLSVTRADAKPCPLSDITRTIVRVEQLVSVSGVTIIVEGVDDLTAPDQALVGQLAWNVLHNCGKYAMMCSMRENKASPLVTIVGASDKRYERSQEVVDLVLTITDNGQGFYNSDGTENTHLMSSCFDPGVKGDDGGSGKGYGMFIARQCARALGGDLTVSNRKDGVKGAVFEARIPVSSKPAMAATESSGAGASTHPAP